MAGLGKDPHVGNPLSEELVRVILLQREDVINRLRSFDSQIHRGNTDAPENECRASFAALFRSVRSALRNDDEEAYGKIRGVAKDPKSIDELDEAFEELDAWLYKKRVTRFDTRRWKRQDDIEAQNEEEED